MTATESEIRWGTGYDNALSFAYPQGLDDARVWRKPVPGSQLVRSPAGVTDPWEMARDYCLAGRFRWFDRATWKSVQDFLDWAPGNPFRFIPDRNYPNFYVDGCYLDSPYDDPQPSLEPADGSQSIDVVIRNQAFDLGLAMRGLMFEYVPGRSLTDPSSMLATYSRAGTAKYFARDTSLAEAAAAALRDRHFIGGVRTTLLECARTNAVLRSEEFDNGAWTLDGLTVAANAVTAPDSTLTADRLVETATSAEHRIYQMTGLGSVRTGWSFFAKAAERSWIAIRSASGLDVANFDLTNGILGTKTGAAGTCGMIGLPGGWYYCWMTATTNGAYFTLNVGNADTGVGPSYSYLGDITKGVYVWGAQHELGYPSSYAKSVAAAGVRVADSLAFPFAFVPQATTMYAKFTERGTAFINNARILQIGKADDGNARFGLALSGGFYTVFWSNGTTTPIAHLGALPSYGDTVELLGVLNADGSVAIYQSINGGAATSATDATTVALSAAWSDTLIWLNGSAVQGQGLIGIQSVKVAAGVKTMAQMRAI